MIPLSRPLARRLGALALGVPPLVAAILVGATLRHHEWNEPLFVASTYYVLWALLVTYLVAMLQGARPDVASVHAWARANVAGLAVTALVTCVVVVGVAPGFRVLADEANLVAVSKNLYFSKTANFAVTGKWYFENYWNINVTTDRRPALFPFLVSLVHVVRGYRADNAFCANAFVFAAFVFTAYRLAKRLGGEVFGVAAALLAGASPIGMVCARSAGFDLLATLVILAVVDGFQAYCVAPNPRRLALLSLHLCALAHVRVEGLGLVGAAVIAVVALRVVRWSDFRGFGYVYALVPVFLACRLWQTVAKANDEEQPMSAALFSRSYFVKNASDYFALARHPFTFDGPHAPLLVLLAGVALVGLAAFLVGRARAGAWRRADVSFAVFVSVIAAAEAVLTFAYMFGQSAQPASARLYLWLDTLVGLVAAWGISALSARVAAWRKALGGDGRSALLAVPVCAVLFAIQVPIASEGRFMNALILTRDAAQEWRFFEQLGDKRILVLADRPGLFTIMDYGALDISIAGADRNCLFELSRHLYRDIYVIQEISYQTKQPLPGFAVWPDVPMETVLAFQSSDSTYIRIARVKPSEEEPDPANATR